MVSIVNSINYGEEASLIRVQGKQEMVGGFDDDEVFIISATSTASAQPPMLLPMGCLIYI